MSVDFIKRVTSDSRVKVPGYDFYKPRPQEVMPSGVSPEVNAQMPKSIEELEAELEADKQKFEAEKKAFEQEVATAASVESEPKVIKRRGRAKKVA